MIFNVNVKIWSNKSILWKGYIDWNDGTGKSKFGRQIANILKFNFYDVDHLIEKEFKMTIKELFQKHGEVFRTIEKNN